MPRAAPDRSDDKVDFGLILLVTSLVAIGPLSISFYIPSMPAIGVALEADANTVQKTMTAYLAGFALAQLVFGPLSDRFGRRPVILGGLGVYIAATLACALAPDVLWLILGRFVQGVAASVAPVVGRAVVRDLFDGRAAMKAYAMVGSVIGLAPAIGPALGGLVQAGFGWQANFLFLALVAAAVLTMVTIKLGETNREPVADATRPGRLLSIYGGLLANRTYTAYVGTLAMTFAGLFAYTTDAPFLFIRELGVGESVFGFLIVFTVGAYVLGNALAGRAMGRGMAPRRVIAAGLTLNGLGAGAMLAFSGELSLVAVIAPMMVYMIGFGLILPAGTAGALQPFPRVAGSASALMGCLQMGAGALSSVLAALFYAGTATSLAAILLGAAACGTIAFARMPLSKAEGGA